MGDERLPPVVQAALQGLVADVATDPAVCGLSVFVVGGAVRDALLGLPAGDRDWVVVGSNPEVLARRGFTPVGGDFPVFLHPQTHEEYALARTERKSGRGYRGFVFHAGPEVTLAQDLQRRDLTVNAIALDAQARLHDPWGGQADLRARRLRHVGSAFAEDPVRLLRLGRFAARFTEFDVAPETLALCRAMVAAGEVDALVPERVWREVSRGLLEAQPQRLFDLLAEVAALERVVPEWGQVWREQPEVFQRMLRLAGDSAVDLPGRYAMLCLPIPNATAVHQRLRVPAACADAAGLLAHWRDALADDAESGLSDTAEAIVERIERCDGLRRPERFAQVLGWAARVWPDSVSVATWEQALQVVRAVDAGAVAKAHAGKDVRLAVRRARVLAVAAAGLAESADSA